MLSKVHKDQVLSLSKIIKQDLTFLFNRFRWLKDLYLRVHHCVFFSMSIVRIK